MNETEGRHGLSWPMVLGFAFALPFVTGFLLIGGEQVFRLFKWLFLALAIGLCAVGVGVGIAIPLRQWRRGPEQPDRVREVIKDGTQRVIERNHYGLPPSRYALPESRPVDPLAYPALVNAAYQAGTLGRTQDSTLVAPLESWDGDDVPAPLGWDGEIVQ